MAFLLHIIWPVNVNVSICVWLVENWILLSFFVNTWTAPWIGCSYKVWGKNGWVTRLLNDCTEHCTLMKIHHTTNEMQLAILSFDYRLNSKWIFFFYFDIFLNMNFSGIAQFNTLLITLQLQLWSLLLTKATALHSHSINCLKCPWNN